MPQFTNWNDVSPTKMGESPVKRWVWNPQVDDVEVIILQRGEDLEHEPDYYTRLELPDDVEILFESDNKSDIIEDTRKWLKAHPYLYSTVVWDNTEGDYLLIQGADSRGVAVEETDNEHSYLLDWDILEQNRYEFREKGKFTWYQTKPHIIRCGVCHKKGTYEAVGGGKPEECKFCGNPFESEYTSAEQKQSFGG